MRFSQDSNHVEVEKGSPPYTVHGVSQGKKSTINDFDLWFSQPSLNTVNKQMYMVR